MSEGLAQGFHTH